MLNASPGGFANNHTDFNVPERMRTPLLSPPGPKLTHVSRAFFCSVFLDVTTSPGEHLNSCGYRGPQHRPQGGPVKDSRARWEGTLRPSQSLVEFCSGVSVAESDMRRRLRPTYPYSDRVENRLSSGSRPLSKSSDSPTNVDLKTRS
jgi:hypothetical protein